MGLTVSAKHELSRVEIGSSSARKAEVSALLRFAGGLYSLPGRLVVQAEVNLHSTARRLQAAIADLYGHRSEVFSPSAGRVRSGGRYIVRIVHGSEVLARQAGLLDGRGNPVRGLSPVVVNGSTSDIEAAWRAAFLAQGSIIEQGRSTLLRVMCPGPETALALVGAARRLGIQATARELRGVDCVVIRDYDTIAALLTRMGANTSTAKWQERRRANDVKVAAGVPS